MTKYVLTPLEDRFWPKVEKTETCWLWKGAIGKANGYGVLKAPGRDGRLLLAHRIAYELLVDPIPEGKQIDHLCLVRRCVRPEHLEVVTSRENTIRGPRVQRARQSATCPRGHAWAEYGRLVANGNRPKKRHCLACMRARDTMRGARGARVASAELADQEAATPAGRSR